MVTERDIWATAKMLVDQHGADALIHAAMRADEMLDRGDIDGQAVWIRIMRAAKDLLSLANTAPAGGTTALEAIASKLTEMVGDDAEQYAGERAERLEVVGRDEAAQIWRAFAIVLSQRRGTPTTRH